MMKSLVVLAVLLPFVVGQVDVLSPLADLSAPANNYEMIEEINASNGKWWAKANWPEDWTLADVRSMLGGFIDPEDISGEFEAEEGYVAPDAFTWTEEMPECVDAIRDQGRCGSCWAFAEVQVFQDRYCIHSKGEKAPVLAPQDPVSCDKGNMGCRGGRLSSWKWMEKNGVVTEECMPYTSGGGERGKCPSACTGSGDWVKHFVQKKTSKSCNGEKAMKEAIATQGPIEVAFKVYEDFIAYGGGVYSHTTGKFLGGHAVRAVGYGEDNGTPYWLIANSWSPGWGEDGYFRFIRGTNDCGLEKQTVAGLPDYSR